MRPSSYERPAPIQETITYSCGHEREVTGPKIPDLDVRYSHWIKSWRSDLEALPCLECRLENVASHGYRPVARRGFDFAFSTSIE